MVDRSLVTGKKIMFIPRNDREQYEEYCKRVDEGLRLDFKRFTQVMKEERK